MGAKPPYPMESTTVIGRSAVLPELHLVKESLCYGTKCRNIMNKTLRPICWNIMLKICTAPVHQCIGVSDFEPKQHAQNVHPSCRNIMLEI